MPPAPDHPVLAVIAPPRLEAFRARLGLRDHEPIDADFTGWSKLALLTPTKAVLVPRDHTQVDALRREVTALRAVAEVGLPTIPRVLDLVEDPAICAYPILVEARLPGVPLSGLLDRIEPSVLADRFADLGRLAAHWHLDPASAPTLPRRDALEETTTLEVELELDARLARTARRALERARALAPVVVHGDLHEGQLLVEPGPPHALTGILDWQTARVDHPFVEFDLGEWGTALWRHHRHDFPELRRRAWLAYAGDRGLPDDLAPVFEWHHATTHARRLLGRRGFPVAHGPGVVGTLAEARERVVDALAAMGA